MKLTELSVEQFLAETASSSPAPGGGSVSALAGALAAALAGMVANLTQGEKFADREKRMQTAAAEAQELCKELKESVQKDTESFDGYMAALRLPKDTQEQKESRRQAMQEALKQAAQVPLETAERAARVFPLARLALEEGNPNAESDALVSAMLARTAVLGALFNVSINLGGIKDESFCQKMRKRVQELRRYAEEQEKELLSLSPLGKEF